MSSRCAGAIDGSKPFVRSARTTGRLERGYRGVCTMMKTEDMIWGTGVMLTSFAIYEPGDQPILALQGMIFISVGMMIKMIRELRE